jgi:hypothetical protein
MILQQYIKDNFRYENGSLKRLDRKNGLGSKDKDGYIIVKVKGHQFKAHRIVWFLCKGYWPTKEIDHINRNRADNRIENLRECTRRENILNTTIKENKNTGVKGVYLDNTKGLKAKYTFHFQGKTYRFRNLLSALDKKEQLWKDYYGSNRN